eukprot:TRINITY_DN35405_c0_g1_i1.p1 TRINITY_DN35405_c0_g1~~TRINITY_DN35405_c0_g1_i1.p1  ORF type:complete len:993 (-),score=205.86 TRINITY_DN35405_c0_g1_i1:48-3026(-)
MALSSVSAVKGLVSPGVFQRGQEVAAQRKLSEVQFEGPENVIARAVCAGSGLGEKYNVSFSILQDEDSGEWRSHGSCSCPAAARAHGLCKHVVALLLLRVQKLLERLEDTEQIEELVQPSPPAAVAAESPSGAGRENGKGVGTVYASCLTTLDGQNVKPGGFEGMADNAVPLPEDDAVGAVNSQPVVAQVRIGRQLPSWAAPPVCGDDKKTAKGKGKGAGRGAAAKAPAARGRDVKRPAQRARGKSKPNGRVNEEEDDTEVEDEEEEEAKGEEEEKQEEAVPPPSPRRTRGRGKRAAIQIDKADSEESEELSESEENAGPLDGPHQPSTRGTGSRRQRKGTGAAKASAARRSRMKSGEGEGGEEGQLEEQRDDVVVKGRVGRRRAKAAQEFYEKEVEKKGGKAETKGRGSRAAARGRGRRGGKEIVDEEEGRGERGGGTAQRLVSLEGEAVEFTDADLLGLAEEYACGEDTGDNGSRAALQDGQGSQSGEDIVVRENSVPMKRSPSPPLRGPKAIPSSVFSAKAWKHLADQSLRDMAEMSASTSLPLVNYKAAALNGLNEHVGDASREVKDDLSRELTAVSLVEIREIGERMRGEAEEIHQGERRDPASGPGIPHRSDVVPSGIESSLALPLQGRERRELHEATSRQEERERGEGAQRDARGIVDWIFDRATDPATQEPYDSAPPLHSVTVEEGPVGPLRAVENDSGSGFDDIFSLFVGRAIKKRSWDTKADAPDDPSLLTEPRPACKLSPSQMQQEVNAGSIVQEAPASHGPVAHDEDAQRFSPMTDATTQPDETVVSHPATEAVLGVPQLGLVAHNNEAVTNRVISSEQGAVGMMGLINNLSNSRKQGKDANAGHNVLEKGEPLIDGKNDDMSRVVRKPEDESKQIFSGTANDAQLAESSKPVPLLAVREEVVQSPPFSAPSNTFLTGSAGVTIGRAVDGKTHQGTAISVGDAYRNDSSNGEAGSALTGIKKPKKKMRVADMLGTLGHSS